MLSVGLAIRDAWCTAPVLRGTYWHITFDVLDDDEGLSAARQEPRTSCGFRVYGPRMHYWSCEPGGNLVGTLGRIPGVCRLHV